MDFGDDSGGADIIDLGAADAASDDGVDFLFDDSATAIDDASATSEATVDFSTTEEMPTVEQPMSEEATVETPTIEEQFSIDDATGELPSLDEAIENSGQASDQTAEIDLDDLGLNLDGLDETEVAALDDLDETELASLEDELGATGTNEVLDIAGITGNRQIDPAGLEATAESPALDIAATGEMEIDLEQELTSTGEMRLAADETGQNPMMDVVEPADQNLLEATGRTQILSDDFAVETLTEHDDSLSDNDATMLAQSPGDEDFDFAKTEALPPDAFMGNADLDATGELPAIGGTDVELDLDDLTHALEVSDAAGDTVEQPRDDATVEQPRPAMSAEESAITQALSPDDMSDDLHDARTMTEVGTKLDLARAYVDMGDPLGARSILEEVLDEGDEAQRQQAQQLLDSLPT
jgi:pilus assembly protein FimV